MTILIADHFHGNELLHIKLHIEDDVLTEIDKRFQ